MNIEERGYAVKFTKNERLIYEFIVNNKEKACFMTSTDIARQLNIGDTSVIRFSKTLGYASFSEFKKELQNESSLKNINHINTNIPHEKMENFNTLNLNDIPSFVRCNFVKKAESDFKFNDDKKYFEIAELILNAENKYVAGFRNSAGISGYFSTILSHVIPKVKCINHIEGFEDELIDLTPKDILILFSFPRYSKNASIVVEIAKEAGCQIIVFTDKLTADIAQGAAKVIVNDIDSISFANSISSMALSVEILISIISRRCGEEGTKRLKKLDKYMDKTGLY